VNLLIDTHAMLWFMGGDPRISSVARKAIEDPDSVNYISMASWWEIAIKCSLKKLKLDDPLDVFMSQCADEGFRVLPIEAHHLSALIELPSHHRDPFDRLIICQATLEDMPVCTSDRNFLRYTTRVVW